MIIKLLIILRHFAPAARRSRQPRFRITNQFCSGAKCFGFPKNETAFKINILCVMDCTNSNIPHFTVFSVIQVIIRAVLPSLPHQSNHQHVLTTCNTDVVNLLFGHQKFVKFKCAGSINWFLTVEVKLPQVAKT